MTHTEHLTANPTPTAGLTAGQLAMLAPLETVEPSTPQLIAELDALLDRLEAKYPPRLHSAFGIAAPAPIIEGIPAPADECETCDSTGSVTVTREDDDGEQYESGAPCPTCNCKALPEPGVRVAVWQIRPKPVAA